MKENKPILRFYFAIIAIAFLLVILFETGMLNTVKGNLTGRPNLEYICQSIMILLSLVTIPLALKFFKVKSVRKKLTPYIKTEETADTAKSPADAPSDDDAILSNPSLIAEYQKLSIFRLEILVAPMLVNIILYYLFMHTSFGYMAIIQLICLCFLIPTQSRLKSEISNS